MSPDSLLWLSFIVKMALTAGIVVAASVIAERSGPLIGALVVTLPIAAGPSYLFLALDHDAGFIAATALNSLAANAANVIFGLVYALVAQRRGLVMSLVAAYAAWGALAAMVPVVEWTLLSAILVNVIVFAVSLPLVARLRHVPMPPITRAWYELPLRALLVCSLVASVLAVSFRVGPAVTAILAVFPIAFSSMAIILHRRLGGPAAAAVIANALLGLAGFGTSLVFLHLTAVPLGTPAALVIWLAASLSWNLAVWVARRGLAGSLALTRSSPPP